MAASDPDDASSALIAQMLREDNPYGADDVAYRDDSDDSDYGRGGGKKKKKKKAVVPKKEKAKPAPTKEKPTPKIAKKEKNGSSGKGEDEDGDGDRDDGGEGTAAEELTASGRRKRCDTGKTRAVPRPWTPEEEVLFREALVLHGRDWKSCATHVNTRDHRAVQSHAQKHFIKMCLQGKPLPRKVAETGEGYTLSGKPLDPNSAAAKAYGFKPDSLNMPAADQGGSGGGGGDSDDGGGSGGQPASTAVGHALVGRDAVKTFDGRAWRGKVKTYDEEVHYYQVVYEDGDKEELDIDELHAILVGDTARDRDGVGDGAGYGDGDQGIRTNIPGFGVGLLTAEESAAAAEAANEKATAKVGQAADKAAEKASKAADRAAAKERAGAERAAKRLKKHPVALVEDGPSAPTEYAMNRPRREAAVGGSAVGGGTFRDAGGGTLDLHPLRHFALGTPGSGAAGTQPFALTVSPSTLLVMDLHAHLCTNEVIGFLGGGYDPVTKTIVVERAFPGRGQASGRDVEMDAVAAVELQAQVEAQNLKVVGWYHSHPVFEPIPSGVDIDNQLNYQRLFRDEATGVEPFVGFIVGPYDLRMPTQVSEVTAFVAQQRRGRGGDEELPFEVHYGVTTDAPGPLALSAMAAVVVSNKATAGRVNPTELWRPFTTLVDTKPVGGPCTKLAKLRASLLARLPAGIGEIDSDEILDGVAKEMQAAWGIDLGYDKPKPKP